MIDLLFKGAVVLATVAVAVGTIVAVGYAFNAWKTKYLDEVKNWLHKNCKNERIKYISLKAICIFDAYVANNVYKMVRWAIKAKKQDGSDIQIETREVSIDVAKGAGCFIDENKLDLSEKVLFDDAEVAAMLGIS